MKRLQRAMHIAMCGVSALIFSQAASAEAGEGFYIGVSGGNSTYKELERAEFDGIVYNAFLSAGALPLSSSSSLEDKGTAAALLLGYQFNPYIAVEGRYVDLGTAEYRASGTVNPPGPIASASAFSSVDIGGTGFGVSAVGGLPLGSVFDLHGRLGLFVSKTKIDTLVQIGTSTGRDSRSLDSQNIFASIGTAIHIGEHFSLSLDWARYADLGDEEDFIDLDYDEEEDDEGGGGMDVDALTLSAVFRF